MATRGNITTWYHYTYISPRSRYKILHTWMKCRSAKFCTGSKTPHPRKKKGKQKWGMYRIKPTKGVDNILYSRYVNIVYNLLQFNYSLLHISFAIVLILYFAFTFYITKFSRYSHHFEGNIVSNWNIASITCLVQLMNMFPNHLRRQLEYCIARMLYLTCFGNSILIFFSKTLLVYLPTQKFQLLPAQYHLPLKSDHQHPLTTSSQASVWYCHSNL